MSLTQYNLTGKLQEEIYKKPCQRVPNVKSEDLVLGPFTNFVINFSELRFVKHKNFFKPCKTTQIHSAWLL